MLLTLVGLEKLTKSIARKTGSRVNLIGYADDFVITSSSKEVLVNDIKPQLMAFLQERGLTLSEEKTHVTHINDGFDFLGFNVRKYKGKLLIKPSKSNVLSFLRNMRDLIRKHSTVPVADLIRMMNPKLRGWSNYYRHCVAKQTFGYVGHQMFLALWRWSVRRHPNKGRKWVAHKYFLSLQGQWIFHGWFKKAGKYGVIRLFQIGQVPIKRHVKIMSQANPFDPFWEGFLNERKVKNTGRNSWFDPVAAAL
jgi:RNA-directed DNA polymerase